MRPWRPFLLFSLLSSAIFVSHWYRVDLASGWSQSVVPCARWEAAEQVGELDPAYIGEASGLGFATDSDRLYHINDSGDLGRFYLTGPDGSSPEVVTIDGFVPIDAEDLTVGSCGGEGTNCLFIADFGDNAAQRADTEIVVIGEQTPFPERVVTRKRIRLRYPDGPRDAESLAVHPNGDLFILTKTANFERLAVEPSILYRISYTQWSQAESDVEAGGRAVQVAERIGAIEFAAISSDRFSGSLPTAMDISADGQRMLVLTYLNAFEFYVDLSSSPLKPTSEMVDGVDYQEIEVTALPQQESVAYLPSGEGFLYTTEAGNRSGAPIMRVSCQR